MAMVIVGGSPARPLLIGALCLLVLAAGILLFMPTILGAMLALWLLVSIPIGIAFGHCALGRDD